MTLKTLEIGTKIAPKIHSLVRLSRYQRGRSMIGNATLYGYTWTCECGATKWINGTKREALTDFRDHSTCPVNLAKRPGGYYPCRRPLAADSDKCAKHTETP